ncbi:unnamed protein product [Alopecurus aequalis]
MPTPSRRRGARHRRSCKKKAAEEERHRNWAEMPLDTILAVLHKLDHIDILMGADQVCRSWRRAARDEPELWRRIVIRGNASLSSRLNRQGMACDAVQRSKGQCEAFCGEYAGDDGFLLYLSEQAPCLKSLRLISCSGVSFDGFVELIPRFPLLEEIELSQCPELLNWGDLKYGVYNILRETFPQLKHFRLNKTLRSLQLFANDLGNEGLEAILDNCPHLESLDIRHCFNVDVDRADEEGKLLREKCARIKALRLPRDSTDDYDFDFGSPGIVCNDIKCGHYSQTYTHVHFETESIGGIPQEKVVLRYHDDWYAPLYPYRQFLC